MGTTLGSKRKAAASEDRSQVRSQRKSGNMMNGQASGQCHWTKQSRSRQSVKGRQGAGTHGPAFGSYSINKMLPEMSFCREQLLKG